MSESLGTLPIGTRVYYTGDMANAPAIGTIVEHSPSLRFTDQLKIEWDAEEWNGETYKKPDCWTTPTNFVPSPGCRFYRLADWKAKQQRQATRQYPPLTAYRVTMSDGSSYTTHMAAGVTLEDAREYFVGKQFEQADEKTILTAVKVEPIKPVMYFRTNQESEEMSEQITVWEAKIGAILRCVDTFERMHGAPDCEPSDCAAQIMADEQFDSAIKAEAAKRLRSMSAAQPYASQVADLIAS